VREDVFLGETELPSEDAQELSLYPVHVSLTEGNVLARENTGKDPANAPKCGIIGVL
jgi:hypothetical protein